MASRPGPYSATPNTVTHAHPNTYADTYPDAYAYSYTYPAPLGLHPWHSDCQAGQRTGPEPNAWSSAHGRDVCQCYALGAVRAGLLLHRRNELA